MNKLFVNNIGDLAEAQRASFYRFLSSGICEELATFPNPFIAKIRISTKKKLPCLVYLYPTEIKLKGPNFSIDTCLKRDMSYSIQLYIPGEYSYTIENKNEIENKLLTKPLKIKKVRIQQDIFFGEIPLMTEEGTFLISGCERVIISQIIRSPGVYFRKEFTTSRKTIYTATVISNKGLWNKFYLDKISLEKKDGKKIKKNDDKNSFPPESKDRIYLKLNDFKGKTLESKENESDLNKIFIYDLIRYFGLNLEEIADGLKYPLQLSNQHYVSTHRQTDPDISVLIRKLFF